MSLAGRTSFLLGCVSRINCAVRAVHRIPHYENHIRFDPALGRKRPAQDALDRFKSLGMWIRAHPGRTKQRYMKDAVFCETSVNFETCTKEECEMLDKMASLFWLRRKHYVNDPYEPYHVRHGITSHRVDYKGRLLRERHKVLLEDVTVDKFIGDR